jgi:hypothetical protein
VPAIVPIAAFVALALAPLVRRLIPVVALVTLGLFLAYVFGEDAYRDNGISRWDAYRSPGGGLEPLFWLTVGARVVAAAAALLGRRRPATVACVVSSLAGIAAVIGFSAN